MQLRRIKMRLSRQIKEALFRAGFFAAIRKSVPNQHVAILRYHAVVEPEDNFYASPGICLSKDNFARHVQYFAAKYHVVSLNDVIESLKKGKSLPTNAVVFTFDDGYADNYFAYEILKQYGAGATFYLTAACIDRKEPFWLFEVTYLPLFSSKTELSVMVDGREHHFTLTDRRQRLQTTRELVRIIKSNNLKVRESVRTQLRDQLADERFRQMAEKVMLTWDQVREMQSNGMLFGAHTLTHLNLPNADPEDAKREIEGSKHLIEERLGKPVAHFSYPNSGPYQYYTPAVRELVQQARYDSAVTSFPGFVQPGDDLLALHRVRTVPSLAETVAEIELGKLKRLYRKSVLK